MEIAWYNNGEQTIGEKIKHLLDDFQNVKNSPFTKTCMAMDKHGSNKNHRQYVIYCPFYDALFADVNPQAILEFGIGSQGNVPFTMSGQPCQVGGSIRAWRELFPDAQIFAADLDRDVLFNEEHIRSYFIDALGPPTIKDMWAELKSDFPDISVEIIVDDAHHSADANLNLLNGSIEYLAKNGWYAIEDINRQNGSHVTPIKEWLANNKYDAVFLDIPNDTNGTCCCMVVIHKRSN